MHDLFIHLLPSSRMRKRLRLGTGTAICLAGAAQILVNMAHTLF